MNTTSPPAPRADATTEETPFDALELCHRNTALALGRLAALITQLTRDDPDESARHLARSILAHFNIEMREHHHDEEQHVFPAVAARGDAEMLVALASLRQDHCWIEQDWTELAPHLDAIANGQSWYDLDVVREAAAIFTSLCHAHVALEESLIYPQARASLSAQEQVRIRGAVELRRRARGGSPTG
jgi:hemerythrin-like domain-containing protein